MQYDYIKFKRGTVWMCKDDSYEDVNSRLGFVSHVQANTRPVLILSLDHNNVSGYVLNVVPFTTSENRINSYTVPIVGDDGTNTNILCDQIKTVDKQQMLRYMGTMSEEVMAKVEKTINCCLGISRVDRSLDNLENTIKNIVAAKFKDLSNRTEIDSIVENIASGLESTYKTLLEEYIAGLNSASAKRVEGAAPELTKAVEMHEEKPKPKEETEPVINPPKDFKHNQNKDERPSNKPKGYWTDERKDYEKNTISYMMSKYEIDTEEQVKRNYYTFRYVLKKSN